MEKKKHVGGHLLENNVIVALILYCCTYRPPRREGHEAVGQRQTDNRLPHHRKGERGQRERGGHYEHDSEGTEDCRGVAAKMESEVKLSSAEQQKDVHSTSVSESGSGHFDHRTEHGALPTRERTGRPPRDDDNWHKNRSERHPPANERGHPPANERGRGGPRRGGDHERRGGPPPSAERQERGGAKDRERERGSGKEGAGNRERKTSGQHDDSDNKGGRGGGGGRRQPSASLRENMPESRAPPRSGRAPLLPNPPGPPVLLPSTDIIQRQFPPDSHSQHEPRSHHQLPPNQHETRGGRHPQHHSKKPSHEREVKGHPDHGYSEVFDIESGEDWENEDNERETTVAVAASSSGGVKGRKEAHGEPERGGPRRGGGKQQPSSQGRGSRDESRSQRSREERGGGGGDRREGERRHRGEEGEGGRRDGRRGKGDKGGRGGEEIPPRHAGQRKAQLQAERKTEDSESKLKLCTCTICIFSLKIPSQ